MRAEGAAVGELATDAQCISDTTGVLELRRRELRRERANLDELRRQWKNDAQRVRVGGGAQSHVVLNDVKGLLDERTSALNRAIDEVRGLERAVSAHQRNRRSHSPGLDMDVVDRFGDTGGAFTSRIGGISAGAMAAEEANIVRRWQNLLSSDASSSYNAGQYTHRRPRSAASPRSSADRQLASYGRRNHSSRDTYDQHLHLLQGFRRDVLATRPASARAHCRGGLI